MIGSVLSGDLMELHSGMQKFTGERSFNYTPDCYAYGR